MKKIYALLVAMALTCSIFTPGVYAARGDNNQWLCTRVGETNTDGSKFSAERTEDYHFSGDACLLVKYPGTPVDGNYLEIKETLDEPLTSGEEYTLSFYVRGIAARYTVVSVGTDVSLGLKDESWVTEKNVVGADNSKWTKYEYSFTAGDHSDYVAFNFSGSTASIIIDDVVLKSETSENYINDSSFEDYVGEKIDYDAEKEDTIYTADEMPKNVIGTSANDGVTLTWINPVSYTGISVYDLYDGNVTLLSDEFEVRPGQIERYRFQVNNTDYHQYQIVFHYADKESQSFYVSEMSTGAWGDVYDDWQAFYYRSGDQNLTCAGRIAFDTSVAHSGTTSAWIRSNQDHSYSDMAGGAYNWFKKTVTMEEGLTYRVSFWIKADNMVSDLKGNIGLKQFDDGTTSFSGTAGTYDWKYVEKYYTCKDGWNELQFIVDNPATNVWIDDVEIYVVDAEKQPYGENIVTDGDFESFGEKPVSDISRLTAEGETQAITLSWKVPASDYDGCEIYQKRGDDFVYIGYTGPDLTTLTLNGLEHGKTYTYRLVPVNIYGIAGEAHEVSAKTYAPDSLISTPVLLKDGVETDNAHSAGNYVVRTEIKNFAFDAGLPFDQIVAVYDGDEMIAIKSTARNVKRIPLGGNAYILTTPFKLDNNGDYTVKVFLLDNRTDMNLYQHSVEF